MKILADLHISPVTVDFLRTLGYNVVRVNEIMLANSADRAIVEEALRSDRVILTQDMDFSEIISLSGRDRPSLISLRLSSSRVEHVNSILGKVLPTLEKAVNEGAIISVEDSRLRIRGIPFSRN